MGGVLAGEMGEGGWGPGRVGGVLAGEMGEGGWGA